MDGVDLPGRIGGYAVERELGAGGMGTVYLARSRGGRRVAVKVARPELAGDAHFRARFRAEVEAARKVGGFHTAPVVDADPDAAAPWLATAYIAGPTLSGLLAEQGPMDERQLRSLAAALAEALQAIHACGLVHRDMKPGNIIMAEDGPRVLDFGIARALESTRITSTGAAFGTPGFLAPEQAQGREVGGAADVFALGAVLVAAAGGSAFGAGTPMGLMYRSVYEQPDLSALPQGMRPIVAECLAKEPARRPTPERLLDLFAPNTPPVPAPHPPTLPVPARPPEPTPAPAPAAAAAAAAAAAVEKTAPATADGMESAETVAAARHTEPERKSTGLPTLMLVGALLLAGGVSIGVYELNGQGSQTPFPAAKYKLDPPQALVDGAYSRDQVPLEKKLENNVNHKDAFGVEAYYTQTLKGRTFRQVSVSGTYGRLKHLEQEEEQAAERGLLLKSVIAEHEKVLVPRREIRVPGSDVVFSCETAAGYNSNVIVCVWADSNTTCSVTFRPTNSTDSQLDLAAEETRKIREEMQEPVT
ncbi:serine/threonine-protein kinase [Streptomyces cirratus]|uniref:serine/threonine-protein kinase n=1 Tax=Streptomyces cirratus TaxID=68187 RepID=UPI0035711A4E